MINKINRVKFVENVKIFHTQTIQPLHSLMTQNMSYNKLLSATSH